MATVTTPSLRARFLQFRASFEGVLLVPTPERDVCQVLGDEQQLLVDQYLGKVTVGGSSD